MKYLPEINFSGFFFAFYFENPLSGLLGIFTQKPACLIFLKTRLGNSQAKDLNLIRAAPTEQSLTIPFSRRLDRSVTN
jgi:hypothetical protein